MMTRSHNATTYEEIRAAMLGEAYTMTLVQEDAVNVMVAVNQGIDSHLEACHVPDRGDSYEWNERGRLVCSVSVESLPVLLRRLGESEDEEANSMRTSILSTLEIEEV